MMKKYHTVIIILILIFFIHCEKKQQERMIGYSFNSKSIAQQSYFLVFTPRGEEKPHPVLYLLNGYGADPYAWASGANLESGAVEYEMYIVSIASGPYAYINDPIDSTKRYEDYVLEIIELVDNNFNTLNSKNSRGISGMSMGGGGALSIAARHPDMFISASALSAGMLGSVYSVAHNLKEVKVMFDCGIQDGILADNRNLHNYLTDLNVPHTYHEYQGEHNWLYWGAHYWDHFNFHSTYFSR